MYWQAFDLVVHGNVVRGREIEHSLQQFERLRNSRVALAIRRYVRERKHRHIRLRMRAHFERTGRHVRWEPLRATFVVKDALAHGVVTRTARALDRDDDAVRHFVPGVSSSRGVSHVSRTAL